MNKILIIITSLVFLTGCGTSSYNTGNIANGGSAESVQESKTTDKHPKDTQKATASDTAGNVIGGVIVGGVVILFILLLGLAIKETTESYSY